MKITNMYSNGFTFSNCSNISKVNLLSRYHTGEDLERTIGDSFMVYFDSDRPGIHGHVLQMLREILFLEEITLGSAVDDGVYSCLVMEYALISDLYRFSVEFPHCAEMTRIGIFYADLVRHFSFLEKHFRVVLDFDEPDPVSLEVISLPSVLAWRTLMDFSQQKIINLSLIGGGKVVQ